MTNELIATEDIFRFSQYYSSQGKSLCWYWKGCIASDGYGRFWFQGFSEKSHRMAYRIANGKINPGSHVLHTCDNPSCVNPDHLFLGSNKDNVADRVMKGRCAKGEDIGSAQLINWEVIQINRLFMQKLYSTKQIAYFFSVSVEIIQRIRNGKTFSHVTGLKYKKHLRAYNKHNTKPCTAALSALNITH